METPAEPRQPELTYHGVPVPRALWSAAMCEHLDDRGEDSSEVRPHFENTLRWEGFKLGIDTYLSD